jgi:hypothetical protein
MTSSNSTTACGADNVSRFLRARRFEGKPLALGSDSAVVNKVRECELRGNRCTSGGRISRRERVPRLRHSVIAQGDESSREVGQGGGVA